MATPTEMLADMRDELSRLPDQIAEYLARRAAGPTDSSSGSIDPGGDIAQDIVDRVEQMVSPEYGDTSDDVSPENPQYESISNYQDISSPEYEYHQSQEPRSPDYGDLESASSPQSPDYDPVIQPSGGEDESVLILRQISDRLGMLGEEQSQRPGRSVIQQRILVGSRPIQINHPQESYAAASQSIDVSSIAGAGGASSRRGYGSDPIGRRYWASEDDQGAPR